MTLIAIFLALVLVYSLVSARLERTIITAPIAFTSAGMLLLLGAPNIPGRESALAIFLHVAEAGLVLLLFTDAARTELAVLKHIRELPTRLLSVGMLLTIALGMLAARLVFPEFSLWEAGILAAILAPTDAGLGQIIVQSPSVPMKIRQALNVEAGLNDGLSVPFLLYFIAFAGSAGVGDHSELARFVWEQLGLGTLVGVGVGLFGGLLLGFAHRKAWVAPSWLALGTVALPLLCLVLSAMVGASMFIAAFAAGLAVQVGFKDAGKHSVEFTEQWGQFINLAVFMFFGLLAARAWPEFRWTHALYALLSLTIVRMLPVAIALVGTRLRAVSVLFMGWFGPRGLASIVLGLVFLEQALHEANHDDIRLAVMTTVLASIFAHGLSAKPGMELYARRLATLPPDSPELEKSGSTTP